MKTDEMKTEIKHQKQSDLFTGNSAALFARFALPQMIGLLFNSIYIIVDGLFIGNILGRNAMAAAAVGVPLVEVLISLSMAITSGAGIIAARLLGRKEKKQAAAIFNLACRIALTAGIGIAIFGRIFLTPLARLLGATSQILPEAETYLKFIITFCPFLIFSYLLGGMARNDGKPKLAMCAMTIGSVSNIFLDFLFMVPLKLGIGGAALATAIGPVLSDAILLPHFLKKEGALYFMKTARNPRRAGAILKLGFPSFIMEFTIGIITFIYNAAIRFYGFGEVGLAAYLIIGYLMLILLTLFLGFAEGLQPVFSHFLGTGEKTKEEAMLRFSVRVFLLVGLAACILLFFFSGKFCRLFCPDDPELITFTEKRCRFYFFGFFLAGLNILLISFFQSTEKTMQALAVSLSRSLIFPPVLVLILPQLFGKETLWLCHSISECLTALTAFFLLRKTVISEKKQP